MGALILEPNYRGSVGYGEDFRALNVRNLRTGDGWLRREGRRWLSIRAGPILTSWRA